MLTKQAFPMIRTARDDITSIVPERAPCGRTIRRIDRSARSDDMMIIRGGTSFGRRSKPRCFGGGNRAALPDPADPKGGLDQLEVRVEVTKEMFGDRISELGKRSRRSGKAIDNIVGLRVPVRMVEPHTIGAAKEKPKTGD